MDEEMGKEAAFSKGPKDPKHQVLGFRIVVIAGYYRAKNQVLRKRIVVPVGYYRANNQVLRFRRVVM